MAYKNPHVRFFSVCFHAKKLIVRYKLLLLFAKY